MVMSLLKSLYKSLYKNAKDPTLSILGHHGGRRKVAARQNRLSCLRNNMHHSNPCVHHSPGIPVHHAATAVLVCCLWNLHRVP